jgi:hypothetical protein
LKSTPSRGGKSPTKIGPGSPKAYIPKGYSMVTSLEDKLKDVERQNKELKKEIALLNKV